MLMSRRATTAAAVIGILLPLHMYLLDGIDGAVLARVHGDTTVYAGEYQNAAFRQIHVETPERDLRRLLGQPLGETWIYDQDGCHSIYLRDPTVGSYVSPTCRDKGIQPGSATADLRRLLGPPKERILFYSDSPGHSYYRMRVVHLRDGKVARIVTGFYTD